MNAVLTWVDALPSAVPAWLAFVMSATLTAIKIWELVRDRIRIQVDGAFSSHADAGNEIHIRNIATRPLILVFWEVFYRTKPLLFRKEEQIESDVSFEGITIPPATTHSLEFKDISWFSTAHSVLDGRAVYIRLHFAGRRPLVRRLYPF